MVHQKIENIRILKKIFTFQNLSLKISKKYIFKKKKNCFFPLISIKKKIPVIQKAF